jgi:hypothetical protein
VGSIPIEGTSCRTLLIAQLVERQTVAIHMCVKTFICRSLVRFRLGRKEIFCFFARISDWGDQLLFWGQISRTFLLARILFGGGRVGDVL